MNGIGIENATGIVIEIGRAPARTELETTSGALFEIRFLCGLSCLFGKRKGEKDGREYPFRGSGSRGLFVLKLFAAKFGSPAGQKIIDASRECLGSFFPSRGIWTRLWSCFQWCRCGAACLLLARRVSLAAFRLVLGDRQDGD